MAKKTRFDWLAPFRIKPQNVIADYSSSHRTKGVEYHHRFAELPGRRLAWQFESRFLEEYISKAGRIGSHLDFAGGTGRIAGALASHCDRQIILDVSKTMLAVAAEHVVNARLICSDFRSNLDIVPPGSVDLVTAFRFFPNAEESLRNAAMAFIARALAPGARLICNNHRNFWSLTYITGRLIFSRAAGEGMTSRQVLQLAARHGLTLVETRSIGLIPQTDRKALLPWAMVAGVENFIWKRWSRRQRLGYDVIYVFEKSSR